jgi:hypothetical protein
MPLSSYEKRPSVFRSHEFRSSPRERFASRTSNKNPDTKAVACDATALILNLFVNLSDINITLHWKPETVLKLVQIDDDVSRQALMSEDDEGRVRVRPVGQSGPRRSRT